MHKELPRRQIDTKENSLIQLLNLATHNKTENISVLIFVYTRTRFYTCTLHNIFIFFFFFFILLAIFLSFLRPPPSPFLFLCLSLSLSQILLRKKLSVIQVDITRPWHDIGGIYKLLAYTVTVSLLTETMVRTILIIVHFYTIALSVPYIIYVINAFICISTH